MDERDLTGWKEIAAFLRVSERTAQRFERELGLPVARLGSGKRAAVRASAIQLRRWVERMEQQAAGLGEVGGGAAEVRAPEVFGTPVLPTLRRRSRLVVLGAPLGALALILVLVASRRSFGPAAPGSAGRTPAPHMVELEVSGVSGAPLQLQVADGGEAFLTLPWGERWRLSPRAAATNVALAIDRQVEAAGGGYRTFLSGRLMPGVPLNVNTSGGSVVVAWKPTPPARR